MKAVIMAGGAGTRLRPLTTNQPKPMLPLANRPMMEHVVRLLRAHGFDDIVVTVAFLPQAIRAYFGDGSEFGVRMAYATEESPLGTAGSVRNARDQLGERFLAISGDVLTDMDLSAVVAFHEKNQALATIGLKSMPNPLDFGIVITREDGSIERFLEKPTWGQVFSDTINTGIYVLEPEIFDFISEDRPVDFSEEVFPALLEAGRPLFGYVAGGYWEDVGTLQAYVKAHQDVLDGKVQVDVPGFRVSEYLWLGDGAELDPSVTLKGPVLVGDHCRVAAGAHLGEYTVLGSNVRVEPGARLERSVVHDNTYLGPAVSLSSAIVGRSCDLRRGARCDDGVVLGDQCSVGEDAVISPGVKVYPYKTVEQGAIVNSSIIWETRASRHLFSRFGVKGLANVDLTPELAVRLAMAYGTTLQKGATVTTSRDSSRAARVLKRAVMVGLTATGLNVDDLEVSTVPVTRFQVRSVKSQAGISVRLAPDDPQSVVIRFFDTEGLDISEGIQQKIERLYHREDFRRVPAAEMGDIGFPPRALEHYSNALMSTVDVDQIRGAAFKIVLDYGYGTGSFVMPNVLAKLGAEVLAVNPYAATARATTAERWEQAARVAELVRTSGSHLGAVIGPDGERLTVVDDSAHVLSDDEALFALLTLVGATSAPDGVMAGPGLVVLPVAVPTAAEDVCRRAGLSVEWAKLSAANLQEAASRSGVRFAASQDGGYVFPEFLPAYDAAAAFVKLLDMLAATGVGLSKLVAELPHPHLAHRTVPTPWEQKGMLMRTVVERVKDRDLVLVDGVKVLHGDGWALLLPDPDEPVTHVWAEGGDDQSARRRAAEYAGLLQHVLA